MEASNKHMESTWNIFTLDRKKEFYIAFFFPRRKYVSKITPKYSVLRPRFYAILVANKTKQIDAN